MPEGADETSTAEGDADGPNVETMADATLDGTGETSGTDGSGDSAVADADGEIPGTEGEGEALGVQAASVASETSLSASWLSIPIHEDVEVAPPDLVSGGMAVPVADACHGPTRAETSRPSVTMAGVLDDRLTLMRQIGTRPRRIVSQRDMEGHRALVCTPGNYPRTD